MSQFGSEFLGQTNTVSNLTKEVESSGDLERKQTSKRELPFECHICNKRVTLPFSLRRHLLLHSEPPKAKKPQVKKVPTSTESYTIVPGERQFQCNICKKLFGQKQHINAHVKIHRRPPKEKKPQVIEWVPTAASAESYTIVEGEGDSRFECNICKHRFSRIQHVKNHLQLHIQPPKVRKPRSKKGAKTEPTIKKCNATVTHNSVESTEEFPQSTLELVPISRQEEELVTQFPISRQEEELVAKFPISTQEEELVAHLPKTTLELPLSPREEEELFAQLSETTLELILSPSEEEELFAQFPSPRPEEEELFGQLSESTLEPPLSPREEEELFAQLTISRQEEELFVQFPSPRQEEELVTELPQTTLDLVPNPKKVNEPVEQLPQTTLEPVPNPKNVKELVEQLPQTTLELDPIPTQEEELVAQTQQMLFNKSEREELYGCWMCTDHFSTMTDLYWHMLGIHEQPLPVVKAMMKYATTAAKNWNTIIRTSGNGGNLTKKPLLKTLGLSASITSEDFPMFIPIPIIIPIQGSVNVASEK